MKIEAVFGGILALFVLAIAAYAILSVNRGGYGEARPSRADRSEPGPLYVEAGGNRGLCQCFDEAFYLAGSDVGVMSAQYRTGFEYCRSALGADGGEAWTAGWNARLSSRPYEASCRAWLRRSI
ncbi:MAG: hypothetical protein AB7P23_13820 [Amphiplicatus sp.]